MIIMEMWPLRRILAIHGYGKNWFEGESILITDYDSKDNSLKIDYGLFTISVWFEKGQLCVRRPCYQLEKYGNTYEYEEKIYRYPYNRLEIKQNWNNKFDCIKCSFKYSLGPDVTEGEIIIFLKGVKNHSKTNLWNY